MNTTLLRKKKPKLMEPHSPVRFVLKAYKHNYIPPITDPMGKHWDQPPRESVRLHGWEATMPLAAFHELADYSCTEPTGMYVGKMWKRRIDFYDESKGWCLCWYGFSDEPGKIVTHIRLLLVPDSIREDILNRWGACPHKP